MSLEKSIFQVMAPYTDFNALDKYCETSREHPLVSLFHYFVRWRVISERPLQYKRSFSNRLSSNCSNGILNNSHNYLQVSSPLPLMGQGLSHQQFPYQLQTNELNIFLRYTGYQRIIRKGKNGITRTGFVWRFLLRRVFIVSELGTSKCGFPFDIY